MRRCFLIGHREAPNDLWDILRHSVENMIVRCGVQEFVVGHYGNFDTMACRVIAEVKRVFPQIRLTVLLPYHPAERPFMVPDGVDGTYYPFADTQVPRRLAIVKANRHMVEHCQCLIAFVTHPASNAKDILEYAIRKGRVVENIGDEYMIKKHRRSMSGGDEGT